MLQFPQNSLVSIQNKGFEQKKEKKPQICSLFENTI